MSPKTPKPPWESILDLIQSWHSVGCIKLDFVGHDDTNDHTVEAEGAAKDLNNKHADESWWSLGVGKSGTWTNNSNWHTAAEIWESDDETSSEDAVAWELCQLVLVGAWIDVDWVGIGQFALQNNCNNDAVNRDGLAKDDTD